MRITSTTLSEKKNLQRPKDYRKNKKARRVPGVVKRAVRKQAVDPDVVDLTDQLDLVQLSMEGKTRHGPKEKEFRREMVREILTEVKENSKKMKKLTLGKLPKQKENGESLCMLFTDWHLGKVIKTRSGKHIFDTDIAIKRITEELPAQLETYIASRVNKKNIEEIVIILGGDIVDNDIIYPTQRLHVDNGVAIQFRDVINSIHTFVQKVRLITDKYVKKSIPIRLECLVGNHGRPGKNSETPVCSWDTATYAALDLSLRAAGDKNVIVDYSLEDQKIINVRGHRGLLAHHAPPQSETPSAKKKFGGWYEIFDYDFMCYGHLHHWGASTYNGKPLLMNGSLCGYDDYALTLAVRDDWSQLMWIANDKDPVSELTRFKRLD